jgi:hypothetical protein
VWTVGEYSVKLASETLKLKILLRVDCEEVGEATKLVCIWDNEKANFKHHSGEQRSETPTEWPICAELYRDSGAS